MNNFTRFKQLHSISQPLLINNIWDAASTAIVQASGAKALATSSASLAWSLGYADGSELPTDEMLSAVQRIQRVASIPLTVDIENGYSKDPNEVASLVKNLASLGVIGINIEDGADSPDLLIEKIAAIRHSVGSEFFINARTDVYLRALAEGEVAFNMAIERLNSYQKSGANGGFIPGVSDTQLAQRLSHSLKLPVNLMVENVHTDVGRFENCNIARFSVGPNSFLSAYKEITASSEGLDYTHMNKLFL